MKEKQGIIYRYVSPTNKSYIGQTINEKIRKRRHKTVTVNSGTKFGNAILKYGFDNLSYEVLFRSEWTSNIKDLQITLSKLEIDYIKEFDSFNNGYNLTEGGDGIKSYKHTEETKMIISEYSSNMSKETRDKISKANIGRKVSQETKDKISKSSIGKVMSEKARKNMSKAHKGKVYTEEEIEKFREAAPNKKEVCQYTKEGVFINSFKSFSEASRMLGLDASAISKCCRGKLKSSGGYVWKHKDNIE